MKKKYLVPRTRLGKWSLILIICFFLFLITGILIVSIGNQQGGNTIFDNLYISIPMILAFLSAVVSFVTGTISIIKSKERCVFVFIACLIGLLILIFLIGEILVPH